MGTTNVLPGVVTQRQGAGGRVRTGTSEWLVGELAAREGEAVRLCVRPEALFIVGAAAAPPPHNVDAATPDAYPSWRAREHLQVVVAKVEFVGALLKIEAELPGGIAIKIAALDDPDRRLVRGHVLLLAYDPQRVTAYEETP
jgi:iron(III) transport system ATP-binding protein/putative spermidine/putrescine transport system ATP-binding protein